MQSDKLADSDMPLHKQTSSGTPMPKHRLKRMLFLILTVQILNQA
jgi:hypothetical protein